MIVDPDPDGGESCTPLSPSVADAGGDPVSQAPSSGGYPDGEFTEPAGSYVPHTAIQAIEGELMCGYSGSRKASLTYSAHFAGRPLTQVDRDEMDPSELADYDARVMEASVQPPETEAPAGSKKKNKKNKKAAAGAGSAT
jgi:hypothetical protein